MYPVAPVRKIRIAGVYHSSLVARETLLDFFQDFSRQLRGDFLVYDDGFRSRTYAYGAIALMARTFAARIHESGLRKGDTVVFFSENRPEWIAAFWGCLLRGVVVVPIDYRSSPDFLLRVSRIVSAKLVLVGQDVPPLREAPDSSRRQSGRCTSWTGPVPSRRLPRPVTVARDDVAEIIFTSGATAEPKGVVDHAPQRAREHRARSRRRSRSTASASGRFTRSGS